MKIYTGKGDDGKTGVLGGARVSKDSARPEACGALDELNALLGLARAEGLAQDIDRLLERVQNEIFDLGAELAATDPKAAGLRPIGKTHIQALEQNIDRLEEQLEPLQCFILPGGGRPAGLLHFARTVCRRAERRVVTLARVAPEPISSELLIYLNRLSDLLFVVARAANARSGIPDVRWQRSEPMP